MWDTTLKFVCGGASGCKSSPFSLMLLGIVSILVQQSGNLFLASGSEPALYDDVRLRRTHNWLATSRQEKMPKLKGVNG